MMRRLPRSVDTCLPSFIFSILLNFCQLTIFIDAKRLPEIYWNSTNPLVERYAAIGDTLDIICPFYASNTPPDETEQSIIYRVTENEYDLCQKHSSAKELGRCVAPYRRDKLKVSFRLMNPNPSGLDYRPGVTYYFISTSTGSKPGLENESGGLCASHNLKMVIHVTEKNGDIGHFHHRHHHKKPPTTTTEKSVEVEEQPRIWPNDPLWGEFYRKVLPSENNNNNNEIAPARRYEHNRAERVTLDSVDSKDRDLYEAIPIAEDRIDFQIHEIGEVESLFASSARYSLCGGLFIFLLVNLFL